MKNYHINLFYSKEDEAWVADVPDLRFCSALGETPEAALKEIQIAMAAWLESARKLHKPVPKATYRPAIYQIA